MLHLYWLSVYSWKKRDIAPSLFHQPSQSRMLALTTRERRKSVMSWERAAAQNDFAVCSMGKNDVNVTLLVNGNILYYHITGPALISLKLAQFYIVCKSTRHLTHYFILKWTMRIGLSLSNAILSQSSFPHHSIPNRASTVEPRCNETLYNEDLGITNDFL